MNPVKAEERPEDFPYSSARLQAEVDPPPVRFSETFVALPSKNPRLKPESNHAVLTLGLKAELPRMNAGAPTEENTSVLAPEAGLP